MHENEGRLCEIDTKTARGMWKVYGGKTFAGVKVSEDTTMWNAGVVAIPGDKSLEAVRLALALFDEMYTKKARMTLLEQLALTLALHEVFGAVAPAHQRVGHFCANKAQWNDAIRVFFLRSLLEERTLEQDIAEMRIFDYSARPVRMKGQRRWVKRLRRLIDRRYPPEPHVYHPITRGL